MTEETLFAAALEKPTPEERAAFLAEACAGDEALRRRVEALLASHEDADFLNVPAVHRAAEGLAGVATFPGESSAEDDTPSLTFLAPPRKPGSLGRLGHYEVQEIVAQGGMGIVLRAFDEKLQRVVAIKVLAPALATSATARRRFIREAQAAAAIRDDHVVNIHAVEEQDDPPYLVMEYVAGLSLQERIDRDGPLEVREVLRVGLQTAAGLAAAHAQGLIHRDIKPANILLENGVQRVKITDFGLARVVDDASLTQSGVVMGTPQYMSPEQARGESVDHRTDLFSLGSVLYVLCTGRGPFRADTTMGVLKRICDDTPRPIRELNPDIPDWLVAIIAKLHAKDPADRFQSAGEVAEVLGRYLAHLQQPSVVPPPGRGVETAPEPPPARTRRRRWVAPAVVLLAIGGVALMEVTGVTGIVGSFFGTNSSDTAPMATRSDSQVAPAPAESAEPFKDLGPDIDLVGPGEAYERWKQTSEYQDWLRATGQLQQHVEAAPEREAFVVLGEEGVPERRFDTLSEAALNSSSGDTIEIRGNGPFVTEPVLIRHGLVIRAGAGFRPVIERRPDPKAGDTLLKIMNAPLVLEGLEFRWLTPDGIEPNAMREILTSMGERPLHVANCRFVAGPRVYNISAWGSADCAVRNCEFLGGEDGLRGRLLAGSLDNCVIAGQRLFVGYSFDPRPDDMLVRLTNNTVVSFASLGGKFDRGMPDLGDESRAAPWQFEATGNIFASGVIVSYTAEPGPDRGPVAGSEAEALFDGLLDWHGRRNVYSGGIGHFSWYPKLVEQRHFSGKGLDAWRGLWPDGEVDSLEGTIRFQGGDVRAKAQSDPTHLTPDDFRLRPDSAGYRAGPDGKDFGADLDLVGPGAAYERWKQTPVYQQWLTDTGQRK